MADGLEKLIQRDTGEKTKNSVPKDVRFLKHKRNGMNYSFETKWIEYQDVKSDFRFCEYTCPAQNCMEENSGEQFLLLFCSGEWQWCLCRIAAWRRKSDPNKWYSFLRIPVGWFLPKSAVIFFVSVSGICVMLLSVLFYKHLKWWPIR